MRKRVKTDNGWIIEIEKERGCYRIKKIFALFEHVGYFPIDTSEFTQEVWDIFHMRLEGEKDK